MEKKKFDFIIVGAGISGLTLSKKLVDANKKILIVEKENRIGGLAKSFKYFYHGKKFIFDIGPKRFHTEDKEVINFILEVLDKEHVKIGRKSSIYAFNKYFNWPLTMGDVFKLPINVALLVSLDLFKKIINYNNNYYYKFDDYIKDKYGNSLFKYFFEGYTKKFIGLPTNQINADWASTGINRSIIDKKAKGSSIFDLVKSVMLPKPINTKFLYPSKNGFGYFTNKLANSIKHSGGEILTKAHITNLNHKESFIVVNNNKIYFDKIVWTGSLLDLGDLLKKDFSKLNYLSTVFYNFIVKKKEFTDNQWIYFHYKNYKNGPLSMVRGSIFNNFAKYLSNFGYINICIEKTCKYDDATWRNPKKELEIIKNELMAVGLIDKINQIKLADIKLVQNTYPIYDLNYKKNYNKVEKIIKTNFKNIKLLGRLGSFWYNNADHSIKASIEMSKYLLGKRKNEPNKYNIFS